MRKKTRFACRAVLALLICIVMACSAGTAWAETPASPDAEAFSADGSVIFEKDGLKVTTAGLDTDPTDGNVQPIIWITVENSGGEDAFLGVAEGSVNGFMTDVLLVNFLEEDGNTVGADYVFTLPIPAESSGKYALSYYQSGAPGADMETLGEMELCFTLAEDEFSWPSYTSEPVVIVTGEEPKTADIASLGTTVIDDERLLLVIGDQDYDEWLGPLVYVYAENRSADWLGITADSAEADGHACDYIYFGEEIAPGKRAGGFMAFEDDIRGLKGFENLSLSFHLVKAETRDDLMHAEAEALDPVSVQYPPQVWGEYENGGLQLEIQPRYNDLITVEMPQDDEKGVLFTVSETASLEAGKHEGAGWLFSIGKISEEKLHEMMCSDMSGAQVFAKDSDGSYYMYYHPTDVRFERATVEEMKNDSAQWTMLCEWANDVPDQLTEQNGLEYAAFSNSEVDMAVARAAYKEGVNATLSTTEFGPVEIAGVDGSPYAEFIMQGWFSYADRQEAPDGEYVVLNFPDEDYRVDFFFAPGAFARIVSGDRETIYQAMWEDDSVSFTEAMQGWYYAAAEKAGVKPADENLAPFIGEWHEKVAGRGDVTVSKGLAPGKVVIDVSWPGSASLMAFWEMTAAPAEDGKLVYKNGMRRVTEYGENGENWVTDESWEESGWFWLNDAGELCWHDNNAEIDEDSVFARS